MGTAASASGWGGAAVEAAAELEPGSDEGGNGAEAGSASGGGGRANKGVAFDLALPLALSLALALACLAAAFLLFTVLGPILSVTMDTKITKLTREWWRERLLTTLQVATNIVVDDKQSRCYYASERTFTLSYKWMIPQKGGGNCKGNAPQGPLEPANIHPLKARQLQKKPKNAL